MEKIEKLIKDIQSSKITLSSALLKAKPIFKRFEKIDTVEMIEKELLGYIDIQELPHFRNVRGELFVVVNNLYGGKMKAVVDLSNVNMKIAGILSSVPFNNSISSIEDAIKDSSNFISLQYGRNESIKLADQVGINSHNLLYMGHDIGVSELRKVIDKIKNILLDELYEIVSIPETNKNSESIDMKDKNPNDVKNNEVFIIHGHDKVSLLELKDLLKTKFNLNSMVLSELPTLGTTTIIEKFEHYAPKCKLAIGLFTPDDFVKKEKIDYFQARPNVIFELGWFISKLGRTNVLLIIKEGTDIFSDLQGVLTENGLR